MNNVKELTPKGYESFDAAIEHVLDSREFQVSKWPRIQTTEDAEGRPFEEWIVLMDVYLSKLKSVYAETPSFNQQTGEPNVEGRQRVRKYTAIVANLAMWGVQSAMNSHD